MKHYPYSIIATVTNCEAEYNLEWMKNTYTWMDAKTLNFRASTKEWHFTNKKEAIKFYNKIKNSDQFVKIETVGF